MSQVETDESEKTNIVNDDKLEQIAPQQALQQQQQQQADQEMIVAEISSQPANVDETTGSTNSSSALPTTVIMTQRHRMITTAGQIRLVEILIKFHSRIHSIVSFHFEFAAKSPTSMKLSKRDSK